MQRSLKDLNRYTVSATDGDLGHVVNFLLDDQQWVVRYLVVETGGFLDGRRVLISPISFREAEGSTRHFHVALTMDKVKHSPSVDVDKPVSRQHERDYFSYYGYPYYWGSSGLWGMGMSPGMLGPELWRRVPEEPPGHAAGDVHLRSANEVRGYHILGTDDSIGQIDDFVVDDETWEVRYLVVDTSKWWFGKKVLVAPQWVTSVSWADGEVYLALTRERIRNSPEWDANAAINREYEERLYAYYGRPAYWTGPERPGAARVSHHSGTG